MITTLMKETGRSVEMLLRHMLLVVWSEQATSYSITQMFMTAVTPVRLYGHPNSSMHITVSSRWPRLDLRRLQPMIPCIAWQRQGSDAD